MTSSQVPITNSITESFLQQCIKKQYPAKTIFLTEGENSSELFYILKGSVKISVANKDGKEIILAYLNPGDYFGEISLLDSEYKSSALVQAKTACEIAQIDYKHFLSLEDIFPKLLLKIAKQLALRLRKMNRKVSDLAFTDVQGRIARTLLNLCQEPDAKNHLDGVKITITRKELGAVVGCSREMVGRVLKIFEASHLIKTSGRSIMVYDVATNKKSFP